MDLKRSWCCCQRGLHYTHSAWKVGNKNKREAKRVYDVVFIIERSAIKNREAIQLVKRVSGPKGERIQNVHHNHLYVTPKPPFHHHLHMKPGLLPTFSSTLVLYPLDAIAGDRRGGCTNDCGREIIDLSLKAVSQSLGIAHAPTVC